MAYAEDIDEKTKYMATTTLVGTNYNNFETVKAFIYLGT